MYTFALQLSYTANYLRRAHVYYAKIALIP